MQLLDGHPPQLGIATNNTGAGEDAVQAGRNENFPFMRT